jgi:hypothetical protein
LKSSHFSRLASGSNALCAAKVLIHSCRDGYALLALSRFKWLLPVFSKRVIALGAKRTGRLLPEPKRKIGKASDNRLGTRVNYLGVLTGGQGRQGRKKAAAKPECDAPARGGGLVADLRQMVNR